MKRIKLAALLSFLVLFLGVACSASPEGYIKLESIDREQSVKAVNLEIEVWEARTIDTALLRPMKEHHFFNESLLVTTDSNRSVLSVARIIDGVGPEIGLKLYVELNKKEISGLFVVETFHWDDIWELVESVATVSIVDSNSIRINAILANRTFMTSGIIQFPYNDKGLYDRDIDRYIMLECVIPMDERLKRIFK